MGRLFYLMIFISVSLPLNAGYFSYTSSARQAYDLVLSLRFDEANVALDQLRRQEPDNLIAHHIENYIDFFTVYINEDKEEYDQIIKNRDLRLSAIKAGDSTSPYYLFIQADIRLQWALARLKFGEYFGAFREVSKAYKLLQKNQKAHPDFILNYKDLAILHAMVGTIPDNYKWGLKLLSGLDGTIEQGRRELKAVLEYASEHEDFLFARESAVFYAFLLLHLDHKEEEAWQAIDQAGLQPETNLLHCFILANIAMRSGRNTEAISILEARPKGPAYHPFHYLDFMLGTAKLRRLDDNAQQPLLRYALQFKGQNFIKEAYQKIAWHYLIQGNLTAYQQYMGFCLEKGNLVVDSDKSAQLEAKEKMHPHVDLLKARLLFDGAYFQKAYKLLAGKSLSDFKVQHDQLEFLYRLGRILHGMEEWPKALHYYQLTINRGRESRYYFACNAALQSGLIYERQQLYEKAVEYFETCLSIRPDEFRLGMHQAAKSGLARIKK